MLYNKIIINSFSISILKKHSYEFKKKISNTKEILFTLYKTLLYITHTIYNTLLERNSFGVHFDYTNKEFIKNIEFKE